MSEQERIPMVIDPPLQESHIRISPNQSRREQSGRERPWLCKRHQIAARFGLLKKVCKASIGGPRSLFFLIATFDKAMARGSGGEADNGPTVIASSAVSQNTRGWQWGSAAASLKELSGF